MGRIRLQCRSDPTEQWLTNTKCILNYKISFNHDLLSLQCKFVEDRKQKERLGVHSISYYLPVRRARGPTWNISILGLKIKIRSMEILWFLPETTGPPTINTLDMTRVIFRRHASVFAAKQFAPCFFYTACVSSYVLQINRLKILDLINRNRLVFSDRFGDVGDNRFITNLNVLYLVRVILADWKNKIGAQASDWLRHFRLLPWSCWTAETWQEERSQRSLSLPSLCFLGRSEKQDGRPG